MIRWTGVDLFTAVQLAGAAVAIVLGTAQFLARERNSGNVLLGSLFVLLAIPQLSLAAESVGVFHAYPRVAFMHVALYVFIGPAGYHYFHQIIEPDFTWRRAHLWYFVPFFAASTALFAFQFANFEDLQALSYGRGPLPRYLDAIFVSILAYIGVFLVLTLSDFYVILRDRSAAGGLPPVYRLTIAFLCYGMFIITCLTINQVERSRSLLMLGFIALSLFPVLVFWAGQRYPRYLNLMQREAARARYERTRLAGLDTDALIRRLHELMEFEHLYADEDLSLGRLAEALDISSHQLSEILNSRLDVSFKNFVNGFRVKAAQRMLVEEPDRTVLSIAGAVGFASKSSFNAEFARIAGVSPSEFRRG